MPNLKNIRFASTGAIKLRIRASKKVSKRIKKSIKNEGTKKRGQKALQKSILGLILASKTPPKSTQNLSLGPPWAPFLRPRRIEEGVLRRFVASSPRLRLVAWRFGTSWSALDRFWHPRFFPGRLGEVHPPCKGESSPRTPKLLPSTFAPARRDTFKRQKCEKAASFFQTVFLLFFVLLFNHFRTSKS